MKHVVAFTVLLAGSLLLLVVLLAWYLFSYQAGGGSLGGIMGQMMGARGADGMALAMPGWVWGTVLALVVLAVAGVIGLGYYFAYPEIPSSPPSRLTQPGQEPAGPPGMSWEILMRTSKPEEKKVLEVLAAHGGSYLQKFVVKEAGLSRLKTHRIVSRLAERGVLTLERSGNTNQVSLAPWLKGGVGAGIMKGNVSSAP